MTDPIQNQEQRCRTNSLSCKNVLFYIPVYVLLAWKIKRICSYISYHCFITFLNLVAYNVIVCLLSSIFMNSRKFESIINCPLWNSQTSSRLSWTSGVPKGLRASSVLLLLDFYRVCCNKSLELSENVFRMGFSSRLKHKSSRLFLS